MLIALSSSIYSFSLPPYFMTPYFNLQKHNLPTSCAFIVEILRKYETKKILKWSFPYEKFDSKVSFRFVSAKKRSLFRRLRFEYFVSCKNFLKRIMWIENDLQNQLFNDVFKDLSLKEKSEQNFHYFLRKHRVLK